MKVRALPTLHDLPPTWDGRQVSWHGWTRHDTSLKFHGPPETCTRCGSREPAAINLGTVAPLPGERTLSTVARRTKSGRSYRAEQMVAAWAVVTLAAFRCPTCHHDTVWDHTRDELWELDESDYGDAGSVAPTEGEP